MTIANLNLEYDPLKDPVYLNIRSLETSVEAVYQLSALLEDTEGGKILSVLAEQLQRNFELVQVDTIRSLPSQ
ncbi:MAG: hypothetical protein ACRDBF_17310 [Plesiomonas shigelloides]